MDADQLFARYQELQRYVGWTDEDAQRIQAAAPLVRPHLRALVEDFYAEIDRHPDARQVITGGVMQQIERLKGTLIGWLEELLSGPYDANYVSRRWRVGWRHVEIGLDQVYTNVALSRLRDRVFHSLAAFWSPQEDLAATYRSVNKLLDLDLAIIEDAYQSEHLRRVQQVERLAAIGQISGGVAHELRNPLNVIKTSVYYLLNARNPSPEKTAEHLQRIRRQVDVADGVTTALSDFAKLPLPQFQPFELRSCLLDALETAELPENIHLSLSWPSGIPCVLGDQRQLTIAFGNLIRNARDAMPRGGQLTISATNEDGLVDVAISDTGVGIHEDDLGRILDPLFSTKARGIGLGLTITRAILDKHHAELAIASRPGEGSTFTVRLAAQIPGRVA